MDVVKEYQKKLEAKEDTLDFYSDESIEDFEEEDPLLAAFARGYVNEE